MDGSFIHRKDLGNFGNRQLVKIAQHKDDPMPFIQLVDGAPEGCFLFVLDRGFFR